MPGPNNVYKPKMAGFLIAAIALVMVVVVILVSTILIIAASGNSDAPVTTPSAPVQTTPPGISGNNPPLTTDPVNPGVTDTPNPGGTTAPNPGPGNTPQLPGADTLEMSRDQIKSGALMLLDKSHFYTKDSLVARKELNATNASIIGLVAVKQSEYYKKKDNLLYLTPDTLDAFTDMMADLYEVTGTGIIQIRNAYYYDASLTVITDEASQESVEHATGYVVDLEINNSGISPLTHPNYKDKYYNWLMENCWKYGFVHLRDVGNKYSTFRYIGIAHAAALHKESGISFETYLTSLTAYNYENRKKVNDNEGNEWWIYYVKADADAETVYVPVFGQEKYYQVSGDNKGGFVVAVNSAQFAK